MEREQPGFFRFPFGLLRSSGDDSGSARLGEDLNFTSNLPSGEVHPSTSKHETSRRATTGPKLGSFARQPGDRADVVACSASLPGPIRAGRSLGPGQGSGAQPKSLSRRHSRSVGLSRLAPDSYTNRLDPFSYQPANRMGGRQPFT
jgi:hypothetical protein